MTRSLVALALAALLPLSAQAAPGDIDYTYVQAGYVSTKAGGLRSNGWGTKASYALSNRFYGTASYVGVSRSDPQFGERNSDADIGLGIRFGVFDSVDFIGEAAYVRGSTKFKNSTAFDSSGGGYRAALGVRGSLASVVEGNLTVEIGERSGSSTHVGAAAGFVVHVTKMWGVYLRADTATNGNDADDKITTFAAGVRASF